jgi:hypothetical protein
MKTAIRLTNSELCAALERGLKLPYGSVEIVGFSSPFNNKELRIRVSDNVTFESLRPLPPAPIVPPDAPPIPKKIRKHEIR